MAFVHVSFCLSQFVIEELMLENLKPQIPLVTIFIAQ